MDNWQPIETAPKDGQRIFLWEMYGDEPKIGHWVKHKEISYAYEGWTTGWVTAGGYDVGYDEIYSPTHWQPLMAPPKDAV